ncbi:hypothetical protein PUMCH_004128 [Australozyma saopauloensis]|uniref:Uncharacterized protein n=1 Tax=Australozyma saopauloensis TaxID=291208 RepID=A0AAX4HET5_9ASCO|nr:hypothetical protein PUMCH_004128 [[Candida] saopauloensis]
MINTGPGPSSE